MGDIILQIVKACIVGFFGLVFLGNLLGLVLSKKHVRLTAELYFEKQLWMVISLLIIAIVLGNL